MDGTARFIHDTPPTRRTLHAALLRSPHPHALIGEIDTSVALSVDGVRAVLTGADIAPMCRPLANIVTSDAPLYPLGVDRVRYVGEPVAIVLADSRALAEDGADEINVDFTPLDAVVDPNLAAEPFATTLHDGLDSNVVHDRSFVYGEPELALADPANRVVTVDTRHPRSIATPMETFGITTEFDEAFNTFTIWSNYGGPLALQTVMAASLGVPVAGLRLVIPENIGGNFGIKQAMYPYLVLLALAARFTRRPVNWVEDRNEHLAASSAGSERLTSMDGAFDHDGRLQGLRIRQLENFGAYVRTPEPAGLYRMQGTLSGPYAVEHIAVHNRGVLTNQVPSGLNRGFGGPQFFYALESLMDAAAAELRIDRAEIRRRNLVPRDSFPYRCASGSVLDSGDYQAVLERALERSDYAAATDRAAHRRAQGVLAGVGLACSVETSGNNLGYMNVAMDPELASKQAAKSGASATATLAMDAFGGVVLQLDSPNCGQGYRTVAAQIVADELGLEPADVIVRTALDTATNAWTLTSGNYANRFSTAVVSAAALAARRAADKLRKVAALTLDSHASAIELRDGAAHDTRSGAAIAIKRLAGQLHWDGANRPDGVDGPIRETAVFAPVGLGAAEHDRIQTSFTYSFQCDIASLEIDPDTGQLQIENYTTVHDAGTVLHPGMFAGQIHGGFAHGFGAAVHEQLAYGEDGSLLTANFTDYSPIRAGDLPTLTVDHLVTPSPVTVQGAKGLGDGCAILSPVVIASAIADALGLSTTQISPPFTPARVWAMIQDRAG